MRRPLATVIVLFLASAVACSDDQNGLTQPDASRLTVISSTQSLDQSIRTLLDLFPKGEDSDDENLDPHSAWNKITEDYAKGETKPDKIEKAKKKLFKLSAWVTLNADRMSDPPDGETKTAAAARLVLYMSLYVYEGPATPTPSYAPGADAVVGVVTPDAPATIVTPTLQAGVQFEAGSVDENTVIVITENPTPFPAECSGPLQTKLCQYPQFYTFEQFPAKTLLKAAKVNVCHVNSGERRRPLADHERFRLAHSKPADPAAYTPGSTIRDQAGESIEILPLVEQTFSVCEESDYASGLQGGSPGILSRVARGIRHLVTPKTAYAIDKGLGGLVKAFSPFNIVDPLSSPDLVVSSAAVVEGAVHPGDHIVVNYTIVNNGTATAAAVPTAIRFSADAQLTAEDASLEAIALPSLAPASVFSGSEEIVVPFGTAPGSYYLGVLVGNDPTHPDLNIEDNQSVTAVTVAPSFVSLPVTLSVAAATVCALTPAGAGYCWGSNLFRQLGTSSPASSSSPFAPGLPGFATLAGGTGHHFCGINSVGSATCWGRNGFGELGNGTSSSQGVAPVSIAGEISWRTIEVSRLTSCGVSTTDVGYCWGANQFGEIGSASIPHATNTGTPHGSFTPHVVDGGHAWKTIVAGWLHACGITTAGVTYCWGNNDAGQLGIGAADPEGTTERLHRVPAPVATTERFIQLSLGTRSTCGITVNHQAFCWGENSTGQIGDGSTQIRAVPTPVAGGHRFSYIAVAPGFPDGTSAPPPHTRQGDVAHTCALSETGKPFCWGWNASGQLGDGTTADRLVPTAVAGELSLTSIRLGGSATCGRNGNQIWCWGSNLVGQLGNGTTLNASIPTLVGPPFTSP